MIVWKGCRKVRIRQRKLEKNRVQETYNLLRIAMLSGECSEIMTEAMDDFNDDPGLRKKYVFSGIDSLY